MELTPCEQGVKKTEKLEIPIVHHIVTDENAGYTQKIKEINLGRAVKLLSDPHSHHLVDRHVNAFHRIAKKYQNGFLMKDLVQVFKIVNICADKILENDLYIDPLCSMLQVCRMPFLMEKVSDEVTYEQIVVESLSQMGYLMRVPNTLVRFVLTEAVNDIYNVPSNQSSTIKEQGLKAVSQKFRRSMIEMSDLSETLVKSLSLLDDNENIKVKVLKLLKNLSSKSCVNCRQMLASQAASVICLNLVSSNEVLVFESVGILLNLIENCGDQASSQLCTIKCITILKEKFKDLMRSLSSNYHRQLRNDILVIVTMIASCSENAPITQTGLAKDIVLFSTFSEVKSHNPLVKNLQLNAGHEDFEFKRLLINFLQLFSKDPSAKLLYTEGNVMLSLLSFFKTSSNEKVEVKPKQIWTKSQFEELQLLAFSTLSALIPLLVEDYVDLQGNVRLLLMLEWCTSNLDDINQGENGAKNSFFSSTNTKGRKVSQLKYCLRLLRSAVFTQNEVLLQDLCDQGALSQLTKMLKNKKLQSSNQQTDVEIECDILLILSAMCERDTHRKELFGCQGTEMLISYLRSILKTGNFSTLESVHMILITIDCVTCCVVGCFANEDYFLENEGIFLLLDFIEKAPSSLHNLIMTSLLELLDNEKSIGHLKAWRGEVDNVTIGQLMAQLWREEEKIIGVERGEMGVIVDIKNPLAGYVQRNSHIKPQPVLSVPGSIADVSDNLRAKIYLVFNKIGFSELHGLNTEDYITVAIIEKYLDFKLGEVYFEILEEFRSEGFCLTSTEEVAFDTIMRVYQEKSRGVALLQRQLIEAERQQNLFDERKVYVELSEIHCQMNNFKLRWEEKLKRTSSYQHLLDSKRRQLKSIQSSRTKSPNCKSSDFELHNTMIDFLQTTTFPGRSVLIENKNKITTIEE